MIIMTDCYQFDELQNEHEDDMSTPNLLDGPVVPFVPENPDSIPLTDGSSKRQLSSDAHDVSGAQSTGTHLSSQDVNGDVTPAVLQMITVVKSFGYSLYDSAEKSFAAWLVQRGHAPASIDGSVFWDLYQDMVDEGCFIMMPDDGASGPALTVANKRMAGNTAPVFYTAAMDDVSPDYLQEHYFDSAAGRSALKQILLGGIANLAAKVSTITIITRTCSAVVFVNF
jgi:hypothetical protein